MDVDGRGGCNKSDRERQIAYDLTYMSSLKNTNEYNKKKNQAHRYREQTSDYRGEIGVREREVQTAGCKTGSRVHNMGHIANIL